MATAPIFRSITRQHVKETFALYNQYIKKSMRYQSAMKNLAFALNDFTHSYDDFLRYEPLKVIIESNNKQYGKNRIK